MFSRAISILRYRPASLASAEGRSHERYRRAALSGLASLAGKAISIGTSLLTVRLTFQYLGAERYGMWMTITSIVMMFTFADLGMSNGLVNQIADAVGHNDIASAKQASASAFWMLSTMAAVLLILVFCTYPFINASRIFNVRSALATSEAGPAFLAFFVCFALNLPLGTVRGIHTGLQESYVNSIWTSVGSIASLVALMVAIEMRAGLPLLVACLSGPAVLASIINALDLFGRLHPQLAPATRAFSKGPALRLFRTGMMFFLLQLAYTVGLQTDNIVIAQILGPKSVADYAVPAKLFNVVTSLLVMLSGAMWPAYADAFARRDSNWIRKTFLRVTCIGTAGTLLATLAIIFFGKSILRIWVGRQMTASTPLLTTFGVQCVLFAYLQPVTFLLNGIGKFRVQVIAAISMAALNLALSILLVKHYGIIGAVLGTVISLALVGVLPLTWVTQRTLKELAASCN